MGYVVENYLMPMKQAADSMNFSLEIFIHQTGKSKVLDLDHSGKGGGRSEDLDETKELSAMSRSFNDDPTESTQAERTREAKSEASASSTSGNEEVQVGASHVTHSDTEAGLEAGVEPSTSLTVSGHAMELGRFMPARYTKVW